MLNPVFRSTAPQTPSSWPDDSLRRVLLRDPSTGKTQNPPPQSRQSNRPLNNKRLGERGLPGSVGFLYTIFRHIWP